MAFFSKLNQIIFGKNRSSEAAASKPEAKNPERGQQAAGTRRGSLSSQHVIHDGVRYSMEEYYKQRRSLYFPCKSCGRRLPEREMVCSYCPDCWPTRLDHLRELHADYDIKLRDALERRGIKALKQELVGVDAYSRPIDMIQSPYPECTPLRRDDGVSKYGFDECAVYMVAAENSVFALPDNGIGVRFVQGKPSEDFWNRFACMEKGRSLLALAGDGHDLFALQPNGMIISTKKDWEEISCFSPRDELHRLTEKYISREQMEQVLEDYRTGVKKELTGKFDYYDCRQKAFIDIKTYGSIHDGLYHFYQEFDRDAFVNAYSYKIDRELVDRLKQGIVPVTIIMEQLPVHEPGVSIELPPDEQVY